MNSVDARYKCFYGEMYKFSINTKSFECISPTKKKILLGHVWRFKCELA